MKIGNPSFPIRPPALIPLCLQSLVTSVTTTLPSLSIFDFYLTLPLRALDTVDHSLLLEILSSLGYEAPSSSLFSSYPTGSPSQPLLLVFPLLLDTTYIRTSQYIVLFTLTSFVNSPSPVELNIIYILKTSIFFFTTLISSLSSRTLYPAVYFEFT